MRIRLHSNSVDNLTHTFVGAAIGEYATPATASPRIRLAAMTVGAIAANAPDADLLYTRITDPPLGYLLHHRGHTHTVPGLAVLALLIWGVLWLRRRSAWKAGLTTRRWMLLIAAALASHLLMDAANSYGTHPFYPVSFRWLYLDAIFVIEPWLWVILGTALALNAARRSRFLIGGLTASLAAALTAIGLLHPAALAAMFAAVAACVYGTRTWDRHRRAGAALLAVAVVFMVMPFVSRAAKASARAAVLASDGQVIDVVADANPGVPWCWSVLTLQQSDGGPGALLARRGTLSLFPGAWPATSCASIRLTGQSSGEAITSDAIVWHRRWQTDLSELRALFAGNCHARAWLQFGRVPYIQDGALVDLRFESPTRQNFTRMRLPPESRECPSYITSWEPPRRDVLGSPP